MIKNISDDERVNSAHVHLLLLQPIRTFLNSRDLSIGGKVGWKQSRETPSLTRLDIITADFTYSFSI